MFDPIAITDRLAMGLGAGLYAAAFLVGLVVLLFSKPYPRSAIWTLLIGAFLMQTLGLNLRGLEVRGCPLGNPFEVAQFIAWSLVLVFFLIGPVFQLRLLGFFAAALAAVLTGGSFLVPSWDHAYPAGIFGGNPWIEMHAALATFSYGLFALLAVVSVMFLIQQRGLKRKQFTGVYQYLPSIQQLDAMGKRLLIAGMVLLSAALIFGAIFWVENHQLVPVFKLSVTCLVWVGYAAVVWLRLQKKLVTRRHAYACVALFLFAMASLWPVERARDSERGEPASGSTPGLAE